jgi:hypothetical protein
MPSLPAAGQPLEQSLSLPSRPWLGYRGGYECHGEQTPFNGLWRLEVERGDPLLDHEGKLWQIEEQNRYSLGEPQEGEHGSDGLPLDTVRQAIEEGIEAPTSGRNNLDTLRPRFSLIAAGETGAGNFQRRS